MFFTALMGLLATVDCLAVSLAANPDGTITVDVRQKGGDVKSPLNVGLHLTGTPAELDAQFAELAGGYTEARQSLAEQLEATRVVLEAAKKEADDKATKAVSKPKSPAPIAVPAPGEDRYLDDENYVDDAADSKSAQPAVSAAHDNLFA